MKEAVRNLQIDLIMDNDNNPIIIFFNDIWKDLIVIESENKGTSLFYYNKKNEIIFHHDTIGKSFMCHYRSYWSLFYSSFDLDYNDIQLITKQLVESNINGTIPMPRSL